MPTWLVHGFRWPRAQIRIHVILQNLDDAAPEWLMAPATTACMIKNFKDQWPEQLAQLPGLRFIEQYDPEDITVKDQPYAYVCDIVHHIQLGVDVDDIRGNGLGEEQWAAIADLRDKVAPGAKLGWFVVVNGDVERWAPPLDDEDDDTTPEASQFSPTSQRSSVGQVDEVRGQQVQRSSTGRSLKKWIGGLKKSRSAKDLKTNMAIREPAPPVPPLSPNAADQSQALNPANGKAPLSPR
ncbi:uncharacterized protein K460DRAFT_308446 [Cucurbitaria berberidis CBS 394.84]|uniref:Uncharacterized protein n=1 Tax=Cucurbitaria berberidis CBS 394.84 TaxID=1168544 RepID=A0A9P4GN99_9PLEO|nr:uncharacterized protein K460DRAFT_308446 [Cucurbitaria berberidis CBS 394.84]KAF1848322.1 hypothetical protein K460DRAFT_308446 [Cucurbitaria berberidis CBS 394.84]